MKTLGSIILQPLFTEKSLKEASQGRYSFIVNTESDKIEIKDAIEALYGVSVVKVLTSKLHRSKSIATKKSRSTKHVEMKKARVSLKKGQKIEIFEESKE